MFTRSLVSALVTAVLFIGPSTISAQYTRPTQVRPTPPPKPVDTWQPTILIDCPTAGTLKRGNFDAVLQVYPGGGLLTSTDIGMSNRLMLGVSYGAEGIVAEDRPTWNPRVEFNIKMSLVDEGLVFPGMALGFVSQGYGGYNKENKRYAFKSKGFYAVASKNYPFYDLQMGLHGGINYSTEQEDNDANMDFFLGADTRLNKDVGLVLEYDFATNDNRSVRSFGRGRGYLNLSLQWMYSESLVMEFLVKNLNNNRDGVADIWRGLRFTYVQHF